jgi:uncharacterized protein
MPPLARLSGFVIVMLLFIAPVGAQSPNSDATAAARELIDTMKLADQFKAVLPTIIQHLKPAIVQNRADVERDFDAILPIVLDKMTAHLGELTNEMASVYANNFTAAELHDLTAFYKSPTGQKLLRMMPAVTSQTMAAGQKFGQTAAADARKQVIEELRNKGHSL